MRNNISDFDLGFEVGYREVLNESKTISTNEIPIVKKFINKINKFGEQYNINLSNNLETSCKESKDGSIEFDIKEDFTVGRKLKSGFQAISKGACSISISGLYKKEETFQYSIDISISGTIKNTKCDASSNEKGKIWRVEDAQLDDLDRKFRAFNKMIDVVTKKR